MTSSVRAVDKDKGVARKTCAALLVMSPLLAAATCDSPADDDGCSSDGGCEDGGVDVKVASPPRDEGGTIDASDAGTEVNPCLADDDCDDELYCNGLERCIALNGVDSGSGSKGCVAGRPPCAANVCSEALDECDCDVDKDGVFALRCGGSDNDDDGDSFTVDNTVLEQRDCDDTNIDINPRVGNEVCDPHGVDEDCNPETFAGPKDRDPNPDRDRDGDGYISWKCFNTREDGEVTRGRDCDDGDNQVHPNESPDDDIPLPGPVQEICDNKDNDCDGLVDMISVEIEVDGDAGLPETKVVSLRDPYCLDKDGDGYSANEEDEIIYACPPQPGYVPCVFDDENFLDCNDNPDGGNRAHPGRIEQCDGIDNDCDESTDERPPGGALPEESLGGETLKECRDGKIEITKCPEGRRWCDTSNTDNDCETDVTTLHHCGTCEETDCHFACAETGCEEVHDLSVGSEFVCATTVELDNDTVESEKPGRASCWGRGSQGRLGDDLNRASDTPVSVFRLQDVVRVSTGVEHACAIAGGERRAYCWGSNAVGQLGRLDSDEFSAIPLEVDGEADEMVGVRSIAAGYEHSCDALESGKVYCWGSAEDGRLGDRLGATGTRLPSGVVREVDDPILGKSGAPILNAADVVVGYQHSCLLNQDGEVECWGDNSVGQLGEVSDVPMREWSKKVEGLPEVIAVAAGGYHTCALTVSGKTYCWGANEYGQLGRASPLPSHVPEEVVVPDANSIAAGFANTCVVTSDKEAWCWGINDSHQLANESEFSSAPVLAPVDGVVRIDIDRTTCALTAEGRVWCWGADDFGQRGDGDQRDSAAPPSRLEPVGF